MVRRPILVWIIAIFLLSQTSAIIFTLPHKLAAVFMAEERVIGILQSQLYPSYKVAQYLDASSSRLDQLPLVSNDMLELHLETVLEILVGNPLHVYSLVARITQLLPQLTKEVNQLQEIVHYPGMCP